MICPHFPRLDVWMDMEHRRYFLTADAFLPLPLPFPCFPLSVPVAVAGNPFGGKGGTKFLQWPCTRVSPNCGFNTPESFKKYSTGKMRVPTEELIYHSGEYKIRQRNLSERNAQLAHLLVTTWNFGLSDQPLAHHDLGRS